ncbi:MAG: type II toxin-antitoxin system VapC family toxin [Hyphomicrobiales bacterium]|nr:type II toxin-antitoxin system VapC family toxin [Hyphomicrobiales bacterium]
MTLADVNVLVYAFRPDNDRHRESANWLAGIILSGERFGVSRLALSALVRITTNRKIYKTPSSLEDAFGFCDDILANRNCRLLEPGAAHWEIFRRLCIETDTRGAMTTDAWYAALAIEHDCDLITYDADFAQYPGLRWRAPG